MSYDYERYDGKRIVVDGEIIGLLAMEFGYEVEEVWEEYHAELAMTEEQERQSEAYKKSLRMTLSAQYKKVATLEAENTKLQDALKALMMGTNAELCADRDELWCKECFMHHGKNGCAMVDAMELLGIDMFGEPLGVES